MTLSIIPIYAGILALIYLALTIRTVLARRKFSIALGHRDAPQLMRNVRAHGNFSEYVPILLILIALLEIQNFSPLFIHIFGCVLVASRISHAFGISNVKENFAFRIAGMVPTMLLLLITGLINLYLAVCKTAF